MAKDKVDKKKVVVAAEPEPEKVPEAAQQELADLRAQVRDLKGAIASGEGSKPGMAIYSVVMLDGSEHFNTYLGVATNPEAAQGAALARAMAKGAAHAVVAECSVVGQLDFA